MRPDEVVPDGGARFAAESGVVGGGGGDRTSVAAAPVPLVPDRPLIYRPPTLNGYPGAPFSMSGARLILSLSAYSTPNALVSFAAPYRAE
jgi:hypothetical protein